MTSEEEIFNDEFVSLRVPPEVDISMPNLEAVVPEALSKNSRTSKVSPYSRYLVELYQVDSELNLP